ncbi:MAG: hypothetical protein NC127_09705, partial [Muribaculum sp.]|nr:hypothetical protein [Muribaculum sp.]
MRPDFAFPQKVSEQSEKDLKIALGKNDGPATARAIIDYYLAETRIAPDKSGEIVNRIDSIAGETHDQILRSILFTLEADIYNSIYNASRWKYDRRTLPLTPLPENCDQWSGEQFRVRISALLDSALMSTESLKSTPISTYKSVLTLGSSVSATRQTEIYYPTLYDFVATKAISLLNNTSNFNSILPWGLLVRHDLYVQYPFNRLNPTVGKILGIYASLLNFHSPGTAPFINFDIDRLNFVTSNVWNSNESGNIDSRATRKWDLLQNLYDESAKSEYSGNILLEMRSNDIDEKKWLHNAITHNLSVFPTFHRNNNLRNTLSELEMKSVEISFPLTVAPGNPAKFVLNISNTKSGKVYIYNVSNTPVNEQSYNCVGLPNLQPIAVLPFRASANSSIPFSEKINLTYKFDKPGQFIAIATIDNAPRKDRVWYTKINVTEYALATSTFHKAKIWALNANDGSPVEGAVISIIPNDRHAGNTPVRLGVTSANGSIDCTRSGTILMNKDGDKYATPAWIYINNYTQPEQKWVSAASGYPSLPLYHPGDSVEWMAICYEVCGNKRRPLIGKEVRALLRDANYATIDTTELTTDPYGRVTGSFKLPDETLSGQFSISVDGYDAVRFMVSDYKLPTFKVTLQPAETDFPAKGD